MNWFQKNFKTIIYWAFLIPILTIAFVSISHVTIWYGITNPFSWAIYLSIGIEIAALSALAAISASMGKVVYVPFGIVTFIQFLGNIFFAYQFIQIDSKIFLDWVEMVDPLVSYLGVESGNLISHKRFLALFAGGMLPLISLSFLHMLVKFEEEEKKKSVPPISDSNINNLSEQDGQQEPKTTMHTSETISEGKYTPTDEDLENIQMILNKMQETKFAAEEPLLEQINNPTQINRLTYTKL